MAAANGGYDPDRIVKLRELVDAHPDDPMYRFLLAGLYKNGRYFEEAFQEYKRVLDSAPSTYQARINVGNIYFVLGQYGEAILNYRKALDIRPNSALAYYDMYLAQSDSFKLKEATESLGSARNLDPAQVNAWLSAGSAGGPRPEGDRRRDRLRLDLAGDGRGAEPQGVVRRGAGAGALERGPQGSRQHDEPLGAVRTRRLRSDPRWSFADAPWRSAARAAASRFASIASPGGTITPIAASACTCSCWETGWPRKPRA